MTMKMKNNWRIRINLNKADIIKKVKEEEINKSKALSDEGKTNQILKRMIKKALEAKINLSNNFQKFKSDLYRDRDKTLIKTLNKDYYVEQPLYILFNDLSKNL